MMSAYHALYGHRLYAANLTKKSRIEYHFGRLHQMMKQNTNYCSNKLVVDMRDAYKKSTSTTITNLKEKKNQRERNVNSNKGNQ